MKIQEVQSSIHELLSPHISGFKYRKSDFEYIDRAGGVTHIFRIYLHAKTDWIKVEPAVFVGSSDVNGVFNKALGRDLAVSGATYGFSIRNRFGDRGNYSIDAGSGVAAVAESLRLDFREIAVPFFEKSRSVSDIEGLMNKKGADERYRPESVSGACLGIAAAGLCGNPDFEAICDDYYEFCRQSQGPALAAPILKIRDYLRAGRI